MHFEETKRLLDDSAFYYIIEANMEGKYAYVNKHYRKAFEPIHGPIINQPYQATMHPDDTKVCHQVSLKCFANPDRTFPATIRKHDGKGGYVITQWEYKALFDEAGQPAGIFCLGYDVTEYMGQYTKLKEAQSKMAVKDNILKEIAFTQSHIIRKPLANILGLATVLSKIDLDQNLQNILIMLLDSCKELDDVIRATASKSNVIE
ncbi:PAS domain-containing protein [Pontibacter sp. CAU 1760]